MPGFWGTENNSSASRFSSWLTKPWSISDFAIPGPNIDSILQEQRKFECPAEFAKQAHVKSLAEYERIYKESVDDPDKFWSRIANELHWFKKWDKVLEWNCPWAKWFVGGQDQSFVQLPRPACGDLAQE